jgi:hypothetical protein
MQKLSLFFMMLLLTVACSVGPGKPAYRSFDGRAGYKDIQLAADRYHVIFVGQGWRYNETNVYEFFLKRSAELAVQGGYDYFVVKNEKKDITIERNKQGDAQTVSRYDENTNTTTTTHQEATYSETKTITREGDVIFYKSGTQPKGAMDAKIILKNSIVKNQNA